MKNAPISRVSYNQPNIPQDPLNTQGISKKQQRVGFARLQMPAFINNNSTTTSTTSTTLSTGTPQESDADRIKRLLGYFPMLEPKCADQLFTASPAFKNGRLTKSIYEAIIRNPEVGISTLKKINWETENLRQGTFSEILNNTMRHFNGGLSLDIPGNSECLLSALKRTDWHGFMKSLRKQPVFADVLFNVELMNEFYNAATKCAQERNIDIKELNMNNFQPFYSDALNFAPQAYRASIAEMLNQKIGYIRLLPYPEKGIDSEILKKPSASTTDSAPTTSSAKRKRSDEHSPVDVEIPHADRRGPSWTATTESATHNPTHLFPPFPVDASGRMPNWPLDTAQAQATATQPALDAMQMLLTGDDVVDHFPDLVWNQDGNLTPSDAYLKRTRWAPMPHDAPNLLPNLWDSSATLPQSLVTDHPVGHTYLGAQIPAASQTTWAQEDKKILDFLREIDDGAPPGEQRIVPGTLGGWSLSANWPTSWANAVGSEPWPPTTTSGYIEYLHPENASIPTWQTLPNATPGGNPMLNGILPGADPLNPFGAN